MSQLHASDIKEQMVISWTAIVQFVGILTLQTRMYQGLAIESLFNIDTILAPRHTKEVAYKTLVRPQLEYAAPIWHPYHETQTEKVEKVQKTAARWTCRRWRNSSSVGDMLDELEWPSLQSRREWSSLYLNPAPNLRRTRASHELQYTRQFAYSDALKNSFFPRTISVWNSLPSSVVSSKTIEEFKASI